MKPQFIASPPVLVHLLFKHGRVRTVGDGTNEGRYTRERHLGDDLAERQRPLLEKRNGATRKDALVSMRYRGIHYHGSGQPEHEENILGFSHCFKTGLTTAAHIDCLAEDGFGPQSRIVDLRPVLHHDPP